MGKTVYYCCSNETKSITHYDYLKPVIIKTSINSLSSTKANIQVWTRN